MREGTDEVEAEEVVKSLWSVQYAVPGCVCGSGGSVVSQQIPTAAASSADYVEQPAWSHAVHIRLGSPEAVKTFRAHAAVLSAVDEAMGHCEQLDVLSWRATVTSELEQIYRQGEEWAVGVEHLVLISDNHKYADDVGADMPLMLSQLGEVAESSRAGAVQCVGGVALRESTVGASGVLMARFADAAQLDSFTGSAPYQAVWEGNPKLPGQAMLSITFNVAPANDQNTMGIASGFL